MARLFRPTIVRYIDSQDRRCRKDSPNARKVVKKSGTWRGEYRDASGVVRSVTLCSHKQASRQMLAELERKAMQQKSGLVSPYDEHARRPLIEHLEEFVRTVRLTFFETTLISTCDSRCDKT